MIYSGSSEELQSTRAFYVFQAKSIGNIKYKYTIKILTQTIQCV